MATMRCDSASTTLPERKLWDTILCVSIRDDLLPPSHHQQLIQHEAHCSECRQRAHIQHVTLHKSRCVYTAVLCEINCLSCAWPSSDHVRSSRSERSTATRYETTLATSRRGSEATRALDAPPHQTSTLSAVLPLPSVSPSPSWSSRPRPRSRSRRRMVHRRRCRIHCRRRRRVRIDGSPAMSRLHTSAGSFCLHWRK